MKNIELECIPSWRYCNIPRGQKGPRYSNWQNTAYTLDQIDATGNVGVLLGPLSAGVCALDFDGTTAWHWFADTFNIELPNTIMWSSGRTDRCQMAFRVPEAYWDYLKTIKIPTGEAEGFEFRWTGGQSVVPPSLHPTTQREYFWVQAPSRTDLAELPDAILSYWLEHANPAVEPVTQTEYPQINNDQAVALAAELQQLYPKLDYDTWTRVTWAFCNELGQDAGLTIMRYFWPEQTAGEYARLGQSRAPDGPRCTIGTVRYLINQRRPANEQQATTGHEDSAQSLMALARKFNRN
jgi:hypothetical protein